MHFAEKLRPGVVVDEVLRDVSHHHDEIRGRARYVEGVAVDPLHGVAAGTRAGDVEHRLSRVNPCDVAATTAEIDGERSRAATDVDDGARADLSARVK